MPPSISLLTAIAAVGVGLLAYGLASLLQAMAARRDPEGAASNLLVSPLALGGLALDVVGFLAGAVALTELPLFFVQGVSSASILVTALLASLVLRERPDRREALAMPLVLTGLVALALAAEPGPAATPPAMLTIGLAVCAPLFGLAGWCCVWRPGRLPGLLLAMLAGLSYGCASLLARAASAPDTGLAVRTTMLLVVAAHALQGVVLVTAAMRRAPINTVTSVLFATEAVGPAGLGLLLLGDRTAAGLGWAAAAGFTCLIVATLLLSWNSGGEARPAPDTRWPQVNLLPRSVSVAIPQPRRPPRAVGEVSVGRISAVGGSTVGRHRRSG